VKAKGLLGASGRTPAEDGESSWTQAYERPIRRFNLEVILAASIVLMILTAGLFIAWEAFQNSAHVAHPKLSVLTD
jgi:hypothetical protein